MIVALVLLCAASVANPGPNFARVSRTALALSRRAAVGAAVGIAAGATVYMCLAMFGASAAVARVPWAQEIVRVVGGLFLVYLAFRVHSARPSKDETRTPAREEGLRYGCPLGFSTGLPNPQPLVFFLGAFASSDVLQARLTTQLTAITACACIEMLWYGLVASLLNRGGPRNLYWRYRRVLDLVFCLLLASLGLFGAYEGAAVLADYYADVIWR